MNFSTLEELQSFIHDKGKGSFQVAYQLLPEYEGMVLSIGVIYDVKKNKYELDLEWISFGLDLFGENLLEGYLYAFESMEKLTNYLLEKYQLNISDIPIKYHFEDRDFPNPLKDADKKSVFEAAWHRFQQDFKAHKFLDTSLPVVYATYFYKG